MPLFDITTAISCELIAARQLRERLSETEGVQQLAEVDNAADAVEKITVGIATDPFNGEVYELDELEDKHFFAQIYAEPEDGFVSGLDRATFGTPREGGVFRVFIRRQVRESEDRRDAYNFFWDRVSAIGSEVLTNAELLAEDTDKNRFKEIQRVIGPEFGQRNTEGAQGVHLYALLTFVWGDVESE